MKISKRNFKPAYLLVAMSLMLFSASLWSSSASSESNTQAAFKFPKISISLTIGRASKKCGSFGICKITVGKVAAIEKRTVKAELSRTEDGKLALTLLGKAPEEGQTLFIDEDIPLSAATAQSLGLRSATVLKGEYAFGENKSRLNARMTR
jgi:hypothetical protein